MAARTLVASSFAVLCLAACGTEAAPCDVFEDASCIDADRIASDVALLASPTYGGRRAGTPGNDAVVRLVEDRFERDGLEPHGRDGGYRWPFAFHDWAPVSAPTLTLAGRTLTLGPDYDLLYFSGSGRVSGPLAFVGYGVRVPPFDGAQYPDCPFDPATGYDDYAGIDASGTVAVMLAGVPDDRISDCPKDPFCEGQPFSCYGSAYRGAKAAAEDVAGLLLVFPYGADGAAEPFHSVARGTSLPVALVSRSTMEGVLPDLPDWAAGIDGGLVPSSHATTVDATLEVQGEESTPQTANVLAAVPGENPDGEYVLIGAHLDHEGRLPFRDAYYPGADDNASGTAVLLELARAVAASRTRPWRTLVFAAWNAEEEGLVGSCTWAYDEGAATSEWPFPGLEGAFSIDMVGAGSPGLELWSSGSAPTALADAASSEAARLGLPWTIQAREGSLMSDQWCFSMQHFPAVLASTPEILEHPYYHTVNDTADHVSRENLEAAAKLLWATVKPLAEAKD